MWVRVKFVEDEGYMMFSYKLIISSIRARKAGADVIFRVDKEIAHTGRKRQRREGRMCNCVLCN